MLILSLFQLWFVMASQPPFIILRHDRADSLSLHLGSQYASLVHMNLPTPKGAGDGEGALIAPNWVLTAAHVGTEIKKGHTVTVGSDSAVVDSVLLHFDWEDGGPHA